MTRKFYAAILITLTILSLFSVGCQKQDVSVDEKTNIVVVIDVSDSMNITDPGGGAPYFAETLLSVLNANVTPLLKSSDNRILDNTYFGVVTYGLEAEEKIPLTSLGSMDDEGFIEKYREINSIRYDKTDGTNFYAGMQKAYDMCEDNSAGKNLIYIFSDGQFSLNGLNNENPKSDEEVAAELNAYKEAYKKITDDKSYIVNAITVDTVEGADKYIEAGFTVEDLACNGGDAKNLTDYQKFDDLALEFIEKIKDLLNLNIDAEPEIIPAENGIAEFTLDRDYKRVQLWVFPSKNFDEEISTRRDTSEPPSILSVKTPGSKESIPFENGMETGGFLGFNKCKISVSEESGVALKAIIENASKGDWVIQLNDKSDFLVKYVKIKPFPWAIVLPTATICIIAVILILMWLLYIPPLRYRKKTIPGYLTMERSSEYESALTIYENHPVYSIVKKGKFINKGNLTLGTLLSDKNYKNVIIKYYSNSDLDDAHLDMRGKDSSGNTHTLVLYSDVTATYNLNENTEITITWSC